MFEMDQMFENQRRDLLQLYDLSFHSLPTNYETLTKNDWIISDNLIDMLLAKSQKEESKSSEDESFRENRANKKKSSNGEDVGHLPQEFDEQTQVVFGMNKEHSKYFKIHNCLNYKT